VCLLFRVERAPYVGVMTMHYGAIGEKRAPTEITISDFRKSEGSKALTDAVAGHVTFFVRDGETVAALVPAEVGRRYEDGMADHQAVGADVAEQLAAIEAELQELCESLGGNAEAHAIAGGGHRTFVPFGEKRAPLKVTTDQFRGKHGTNALHDAEAGHVTYFGRNGEIVAAIVPALVGRAYQRGVRYGEAFLAEVGAEITTFVARLHELRERLDVERRQLTLTNRDEMIEWLGEGAHAPDDPGSDVVIVDTPAGRAVIMLGHVVERRGTQFVNLGRVASAADVLTQGGGR
jgi:hypothetical protein